ncbi:YezD family protein [Methylomonas sp. AM2-LC]|uniref:YezD family protein n=1 Tax=Methylomonas sp. AM2-LC TaxID=3153301 RepID=UPI0032643FFD
MALAFKTHTQQQQVNHSLKHENKLDIAQQVAAILKDIRFGSVEIVVHDGKVVQIDKRERFRVSE